MRKSESGRGPGEYREIFEIGAALVLTRDISELDFLDLYVRPRKNPKLSEYFVELTGITQGVVDTKGIDFAKALQEFFSWSKDFQMYSWGNDDDVIAENCKFEEVQFPFSPSRFVDARTLFTAEGSKAEDYMSSTIPRAFGVESTLRGHNALLDARTILDGLRLLARQV